MSTHGVRIVDKVTGAIVMDFQADDGYARSGQGRLIHDLNERTVLLTATSVDTYIWTCREGIWQLAYATTIISVSGGAGANIQIMYCSGTTAIASGVAQLTAAMDLEETAPNKQNGSLIASPSRIFPGDSLAADFGGTLTGLVGCLTFALRRIG